MALENGDIIDQVLDLSYNQLTGKVPAFLSEDRVPSYARRIYLTVLPHNQLVAAA
jgi:hypothetical protein